MILIKNAKILENENDLISKDLLIFDGLIQDIRDEIDVDQTKTFHNMRKIMNKKNEVLDIVDLEGLWLIPGAVDVHAHLREPGFEYKEDVKTGTMSAVKGGITSLVAMANLNPVPDSVENLEIEHKCLKNAVCKVYPLASTTKSMLGKEVADIEELSKYVIGFSDDGKGVQSMDVLVEAIKRATDCGKIILSHAEVEELGFCEQSEIEAVKREIEAVKKVDGSKYHFCHLSTKESLEMVEKAQKEGLDISCEVSPHHISLDKSMVGENANFKMNPPLRSKENVEATIKALQNGVASMIATDHAPHSLEEKNKAFDECPNGIIGFETFLPIVYTNLVKCGKASKKQMLDWCVFNPAKRMSLPCSNIEVGSVADLCAIDIENEREYTKEEILSKAQNSPFIGKKLYGFNKLTLVNGEVVFSSTNEK